MRDVAPNYWTDGWRLLVLQALDHTPLRPFTAPQIIFTAVKT